MSIVAKLHIEHGLLALVPTLKSLDGINIRVITQVNTDPGSTVFPFLIEYEDRAELESTLDEDRTVANYELVDEADGTSIYYIEHTPETRLISPVVTDVNGYLLHTETEREGWLVRLLLPDRDALNTIWDFADRNDMALDILEIYGNSDTRARESYGLTDEQKYALRAAYENGYFGEPRDVSLSELADALDLSSTAMSGRLRRGMRNLIAATIAEERDEIADGG